MAALSAIAAYDVSDAESDDENQKLEGEKTKVESEAIDESTPSQKEPDNSDVLDGDDEEDKADDASDDDNNSSADQSEEPDDDDEEEEDFEKDKGDDSMIISEDENENTDLPKIVQPVKLKFKRYSCDSATALAVKLKGMSQEELYLPPDPEGRCSIQLQDKMKRLYEKKIKEGENLNKAIQSRKDFRNPSIYDKLILYLGIEERGTNFAKADFNPSSWRKVPDYEDLARAQREDVAKRERERKTKVEFVTGTVKKPSSNTTSTSSEPAKKSKWDNPSSDDKAHSTNVSNPSTKTTIISAVGPVKKNKS